MYRKKCDQQQTNSNFINIDVHWHPLSSKVNSNPGQNCKLYLGKGYFVATYVVNKASIQCIIGGLLNMSGYIFYIEWTMTGSPP